MASLRETVTWATAVTNDSAEKQVDPDSALKHGTKCTELKAKGDELQDFF